MHLRRDCAAGVRFLAAVKAGCGVKPSARAAGIGKQTGYRWLRESFTELRDHGMDLEAAEAELGFSSPLVFQWERSRLARPASARHHRAVDVDREHTFWRCFLAGSSLEEARGVAGIGRSTAYRWWWARFGQLRAEGVGVSSAARRLRVPPVSARSWEQQRQRTAAGVRAERETAERRAVRDSARHAEELMRSRAPRSDVAARDTRYWELMRCGMTNTAACKVMGVNRRTGTKIRARHRQQSGPPARPITPAGRYLSLRERLQIAALLRLGYSLRRVAAELGRHPSSVKRELDRHRDAAGRYLPHSADHTAHEQRRRPREHLLVANPGLRRVVQRKLNRCWSPDEISGWLRLTHSEDASMRVCPETIYRALLVPGGQGLDKYFPKGTDLSVHSAAHVAAVTHELNTRPRKTLGYTTPAARYRMEARRPQLVGTA